MADPVCIYRSTHLHGCHLLPTTLNNVSKSVTSDGSNTKRGHYDGKILSSFDEFAQQSTNGAATW